MVNFGPLLLRSVWLFGAPHLMSTGFASWQRYCMVLQQWVSWLRCCSDIAQLKSTKLCTMFGCLLDWYIIYSFSGALVP